MPVGSLTRVVVVFVLATCSLLAPRQTDAKIPSSQQSTVPSRILVMPDGSVTYTVVMRDVANNPLYGTVVWFDFSRCEELRMAGCSDCEGALPYDPETRRFETMTALDGSATIRICGSIVCEQTAAEKPVWVFGDGALVGWATVATTDLSANGLVDAVDLSLWDACAARADRNGDYDGDGDLDATDRTFLTASIGAHCDAAVPALATTWGRLKAIHR